MIFGPDDFQPSVFLFDMVDPTTRPPRRWSDTLASYLWLLRLIDKVRASQSENRGSYSYACSSILILDRAFLPQRGLSPSLIEQAVQERQCAPKKHRSERSGVKVSCPLLRAACFTLLCWLLIAIRPLMVLGQPTYTPEDAEGLIGLARALESISSSRMLADVTRFSSPEFNGRQTGTADDRRTALLAATLFHSLGLQPVGTQVLGPGDEPWAQTTPVITTQIGEEPLLELSTGSTTITAHAGVDYLPILDSPAVNVTASVVFIGYGISDPARGFDEYEGLDVRNRIVLFLRGKPEQYSGLVTQADKERVARENGAVAFMTFTGPVVSAYEARRGLSPGPVASYTMGGPGERPLPGCWITTQLAEQILVAQGHSLREIQERLNGTLKPQSLPTGARARLSWSSSQEPGTLINVLGLLPGADTGSPGAQETIVIGAHRDHFGRQAGLLFAGADDNASGTAVILEAARALAGSGLAFKRSILFVSFSGEEQNLLGSRLYASRPARPLTATRAMINVDHAGIGNGRLMVGVTGLPKTIASEAGSLAGVSEKLDVFGFFPGGDHVPFKEAGIPTVTVVSAGAHPNFHQPSDQPETVKAEILEAAARYVVALGWRLATSP